MAVAGSGLLPRKATLEAPTLPANRTSIRLPRSRTRASTPLSEAKTAVASRRCARARAVMPPTSKRRKRPTASPDTAAAVAKDALPPAPQRQLSPMDTGSHAGANWLCRDTLSSLQSPSFTPNRRLTGEPIVPLAAAGQPKRSCRRSNPTIATSGVAPEAKGVARHRDVAQALVRSGDRQMQLRGYVCKSPTAMRTLRPDTARKPVSDDLVVD